MQNLFAVLLVFTVNLKCGVQNCNMLSVTIRWIVCLTYFSLHIDIPVGNNQRSCHHTCLVVIYAIIYSHALEEQTLVFLWNVIGFWFHVIVTLLYNLSKELDSQVFRCQTLLHKSLALPGGSFFRFSIL